MSGGVGPVWGLRGTVAGPGGVLSGGVGPVWGLRGTVAGPGGVV
jgi:hypothetical protein